jgi:hypothetical protein
LNCDRVLPASSRLRDLKKERRRLWFLLFIPFTFVLSACTQHREAPDATSARSYEDRLICQLISGGPDQKTAAAQQLELREVTRAVPYLLFEVRDRYGPITCEPVEGSGVSHDWDCFVYRNGKKVPYVDYHAPLFHALAVLAVPYSEPDARWFEEIERWIDEKLPPPQRHPTQECP